MHPTVDLGLFEVSLYTALVSLGVIAGLLTAYVYLHLSHRHGGAGAAKQARAQALFLEAALIVLAAGALGARTYHLLTHWMYYQARPDQIVQLDALPGSPIDGGLAMRGGLIAGFVVFWVYARARRLSFWLWADAAALGLAGGQSLGWAGALAQGANYGAPSDSPLALELPDLYGLVQPRWPLQHAEIALFLIVGLALVLLALRRPRSGTLLLAYLLVTSGANVLLGFARGDETLYLVNWRVDQVVDLALAVLALAELARRYAAARLRPPAEEPFTIRIVHGEFQN